MDVKSLKYSKDHMWVNVEGDKTRLGLTDYAQNELGDIVFVELPEVGKKVSKGDAVGSIESVKSVSDIITPLTGEILEVNKALEDTADIVNKDPYGKGWIFTLKVTDQGELGELLDYTKYNKHTEAEMG